MMLVLAGFGLAAIGLAAVGLYGTLAYLISLRTQESSASAWRSAPRPGRCFAQWLAKGL
jgi:hypothetical protein